jgi:hypothetical protein
MDRDHIRAIKLRLLQIEQSLTTKNDTNRKRKNMAHDHSWYRPEVLEEKSFEALATDVQILLQTLPSDIILRGPDGTGQPEVSKDGIYFNGDASRGQEHVPFWLPRIFEIPGLEYPKNEQNNWYSYCSTAHKPYDLVVLTVLILLKYHFPQVSIGSDAYPPDWEKAKQWYVDTFAGLHQPDFYAVIKDADISCLLEDLC